MVEYSRIPLFSFHPSSHGDETCGAIPGDEAVATSGLQASY